MTPAAHPQAVRTVVDDLGFTEGPVWLGDGSFAVVSISQGAVVRCTLEGTVTDRWDVGGGPNGLAVTADGRLVVAQNGGVWAATSRALPGVQVIHPSGEVEQISTWPGAPNDVLIDRAGAAWVTDTRAEIDFHDPSSALPGRLWKLDLATGTLEMRFEGPVFINGVAEDPATGWLWVTETIAGQVWLVDPDGSVAPTVIHRTDVGSPDGLCAAAAGGFWVALTHGDQIARVVDGVVMERIALPTGSLPTNVCTTDRGTLLVTASHHGSVLEVQPVNG